MKLKWCDFCSHRYCRRSFRRLLSSRLCLSAGFSSSWRAGFGTKLGPLERSIRSLSRAPREPNGMGEINNTLDLVGISNPSSYKVADKSARCVATFQKNPLNSAHCGAQRFSVRLDNWNRACFFPAQSWRQYAKDRKVLPCDKAWDWLRRRLWIAFSASPSRLFSAASVLSSRLLCGEPRGKLWGRKKVLELLHIMHVWYHWVIGWAPFIGYQKRSFTARIDHGLRTANNKLQQKLSRSSQMNLNSFNVIRMSERLKYKYY